MKGVISMNEDYELWLLSNTGKVNLLCLVHNILVNCLYLYEHFYRNGTIIMLNFYNCQQQIYLKHLAKKNLNVVLILLMNLNVYQRVMEIRRRQQYMFIVKQAELEVQHLLDATL